MSWDYITSENGMRFLAFLGAGIVVAAGAIWKIIQFFRSTVSAKNNSIAAGRDVNINKANHEDNSGE